MLVGISHPYPRWPILSVGLRPLDSLKLFGFTYFGETF